MNRQLSKKHSQGVGYFNHFPKNFLCPYGRQKPFPSDEKVLQRLRPEGCEWLRRPNIAMSELSSTINENMDVLKGDSLFMDKDKISTLGKAMKPLADNLIKFYREYEGPNTDEDKRQAALGIVNPTEEVKNAMLKAIEVGGALFSMGINYMVANRLFANPVQYSNLMTFAPNPEPIFKKSKNILDLLPLLHLSKNENPQLPTSSFQNVVAALQNQPQPPHQPLPHELLQATPPPEQSHPFPPSRKRHQIATSDEEETPTEPELKKRKKKSKKAPKKSPTEEAPKQKKRKHKKQQ